MMNSTQHEMITTPHTAGETHYLKLGRKVFKVTFFNDSDDIQVRSVSPRLGLMSLGLETLMSVEDNTIEYSTY